MIDTKVTNPETTCELKEGLQNPSMLAAIARMVTQVNLTMLPFLIISTFPFVDSLKRYAIMIIRSRA